MTFPKVVLERILERSGGLCERKLPDGKRCFAPAVDAHHIVPKKMGGRKGIWILAVNDERNGMVVCRGCHDTVAGWNPDATDLVPGKEFREILRKGRRNCPVILTENQWLEARKTSAPTVGVLSSWRRPITGLCC